MDFIIFREAVLNSGILQVVIATPLEFCLLHVKRG